MASQINDDIDTSLPAETSGTYLGKVLKSTFVTVLNALKAGLTVAKAEITNLQNSLSTALAPITAFLLGWHVPATATSAGIQAAINAAKTAGKGVVWLGSRTYSCDTGLMYDPTSVTILGGGAVLDFSSCTIAATVSAAVTTNTQTAINVNVTSGTILPWGKFRIQIGSERMFVTNVNGNVWTVQRGIEDTTAAASHANGATVTVFVNYLTARCSDPNPIPNYKREYAHKISGFTIRGNNPVNGYSVGLFLNSPSEGLGDVAASAVVDGVAIEYCGSGIFLGDNAYICKFRNVSIGWSSVGVERRTFTNNGENITFEAGAIFNSGRVYTFTGLNQDWRFDGTSFDYNGQIGFAYGGNVTVEFHKCHFESGSGTTTGKWQFELDGAVKLRFVGGGIISLVDYNNGAVNSSLPPKEYMFMMWGGGGGTVEFVGVDLPPSRDYTVALASDMTKVSQTLMTNKVQTITNKVIDGLQNTITNISSNAVSGVNVSGTPSTGYVLKALTSTDAVWSPEAGANSNFATKIGYTTGGSQGTITWGSSYTLNQLAGQVAFPSAAFTANETKVFTVNNSNVTPTDILDWTPAFDITSTAIHDFLFQVAVDSTNSAFKVMARCLNGAGATLPAGSLNFSVAKGYFDVWLALSTYTTNAHLYLPGVGVITGKTAGNYSSVDTTTPAVLNATIGYMDDIFGSNNLTQSVAGRRPALKNDGVNYYLEFNPTNNTRLNGGGYNFVESDGCFFAVGYEAANGGWLATCIEADTGYRLFQINAGNSTVGASLTNPSRSTYMSGTGPAFGTKGVIGFRIAGTTVTLWHNGVIVDTDALGVTTVFNGDKQLYIGNGNASDNSLAFSGKIYATAWGKGQISDAEFLKIMRGVNTVTGAAAF